MRGLCLYLALAGFIWYWSFLYPVPRKPTEIAYPSDDALVFVSNN